jgi:lysyl-tRNA synthetase class 2
MCFVYDYPASQAALSRIVSSDGVDVGQRFELYVNGMELANGYCELTDPVEQRARFVADNQRRRERGQPERPIDELLLAAMEHGLPPCSGVALGIDRLLMLVTGASDISDVLAFDWARSEVAVTGVVAAWVVKSLSGHAVNPSMGARGQHPCWPRS